MSLDYRIDRNDHIVAVNADWERFAIENDAPDLATPPFDRPLWAYFASEQVVHVWQRLVRRVRTEQRAVQVPFRCDAPDTRRWLTMTVQAATEDHVQFRSVLLREEPRAPVALLDLAADRDPSALPLRMCAWCSRCHDGTSWVDIEDFVRTDRLLERDLLPPISHGICPDCIASMDAPESDAL